MGVVTATVLSEGRSAVLSEELVSIDVVKEVNRIPYASLTLLDGDVASRKFHLSDSKFFEPGRNVEIRLYREGGPTHDTSVFKGIVVKQIVEASERGVTLTVELKDEAIKLTQSRRNSTFTESDRQIFSKLIARNGLSSGKIEVDEKKSRSKSSQSVVQYNCTDWDFLLTRADLDGLLVVSEAGQISVRKVNLRGAAKYIYELGMGEIYNFEFEMDGSHQYTSVESLAWDSKSQKVVSSGKAAPFNLLQGNLKGETVAKSMGNSQVFSSFVQLSDGDLKSWSKGELIRNRMSMLRGTISLPGSAQERCLDLVEIKGVGQRFNGKTIITGICHRVDLNGWRTDIQFGLSPDRYITRHSVTDVPAAGHLPPVHGLQVGVVKTIESDGDFRVRVDTPIVGSIWARLASPDAGKGSGYYFRPEVGDEVVLGFLNDDPRQAVILGSMYGPGNVPPANIKEDGYQKGIVSRRGVTMCFVDDNSPSFFIKTPASNKILFDDKGEQIQITDQHGNSITMGKNGIEIKSTKDLKIQAAGNVEIKGAMVDIN